MIRAIHEQCGKTAFFVERLWQDGDVIDAENVTLVDGSKPENGVTPVMCGSCGANIVDVKEELTFEGLDNT